MRKLLGLMLCLASAAAAQPVLEARTIELKHLKPDEAVSLLKPYLVNAGGSVTSVSPNMAIVTIKDIPENLARMEKVLAKYDHSPATIRLVFQLIEADTGPKMLAADNRSPSSDLDATLRSVLRFSSYRLVAQGVATSGELTWVNQQLAKDPADRNYTYDIRARVGAIRLSDATLLAQSSAPTKMVPVGSLAVDTNAVGSVQLQVDLFRTNQFMYSQSGQRPAESVMSTGLDVPLGNTVVLGTAISQKPGVAIILTVKPELVRVR